MIFTLRLVLFFLAIVTCQAISANAFSFDLNSALDDERYSDARNILKEMLDDGDPFAAYKLGYLYYEGLGGEIDYKKAQELFIIAADSNIPEAQYSLAIMYSNDSTIINQRDKVIYWLRKASINGLHVAMVDLAKILLQEKAQVKVSEAIHWMTRAAEAGLINAQFKLGLYYRDGIYVNRNELKAEHWFKKVSQQGHLEGYYQLIKLYNNPDGTLYNVSEASKLENEVSEYELFIAYEKLLPDVSEQSRKNRYDDDSYLIKFKLGDIREQNITQEVLDLLQISASRGNPDSAFLLGTLLSSHKIEQSSRFDIAKLFNLAREIYMTRAGNGDSHSAYRLGEIYEKGIGVEINIDRAIRWYRTASEYGSNSAKMKLSIIEGAIH